LVYPGGLWVAITIPQSFPNPAEGDPLAFGTKNGANLLFEGLKKNNFRRKTLLLEVAKAPPISFRGIMGLRKQGDNRPIGWIMPYGL
jgi:hypothetical protein